jgi:hypothetical protein
MAKLTLEYIRKTIKGDYRFDQTIDTDEPGRAFVWVFDPWTWNAMDGNRKMESFIISNEGWYDEKPDTVGYFKERIKRIEKQR